MGGGLIHETRIPVQELWLKIDGGFMHERLEGAYGWDSLHGTSILHNTKGIDIPKPNIENKHTQAAK